MEGNSFTFEYSVWHSVISIDVSIFWLIIARITAFESVKSTTLSTLSQMQFSCYSAIIIALTSHLYWPMDA